VAARYDVKTLRDLAVKIRPITKSSASTKVFETLREMIASGEFRPGEKLPSQDELAIQFGVSRNTLREVHEFTLRFLISPARDGSRTP
jgi:DNA-binding transcriptional regulator YhcF (GntR family)